MARVPLFAILERASDSLMQTKQSGRMVLVPSGRQSGVLPERFRRHLRSHYLLKGYSHDSRQLF